MVWLLGGWCLQKSPQNICFGVKSICQFECWKQKVSVCKTFGTFEACSEKLRPSFDRKDNYQWLVHKFPTSYWFLKHLKKYSIWPGFHNYINGQGGRGGRRFSLPIVNRKKKLSKPVQNQYFFFIFWNLLVNFWIVIKPFWKMKYISGQHFFFKGFYGRSVPPGRNRNYLYIKN